MIRREEERRKKKEREKKRREEKRREEKRREEKRREEKRREEKKRKNGRKEESLLLTLGIFVELTAVYQHRSHGQHSSLEFSNIESTIVVGVVLFEKVFSVRTVYEFVVFVAMIVFVTVIVGF